MNNETRNPVWLKETVSAMLVILIGSIIMLMSPATILLAPVLMPVFLLFVLAAQGWKAFLMTLGAGLLPFIVIGMGLSSVVLLLPGLLITAALYLTLKYKPDFPIAFGAVSLAALLGMILTGYISVYVLSGSDIMAFTGETAETMRSTILGVIEGRGYELPPSQVLLIREVADSITPQFIQDLLPGTAIASSFLTGYLVLRLARRFLKRFEKFPEIKVPYIGRIRISPFLLLAFLGMAGVGMLLAERDQRLGSLLFSTGSMVISFLGAVGAMSLIWNFTEQNLRMRHPFNKGLITLTTVYLFSGSWMIALTIADSILDLRNTTGRSPYRWLRYKLFESGGKES